MPIISIRIYISGALTNIVNSLQIKAFYESIGNLARSLELNPYIPHINSDPIANPNLTPQEVFELDKHQVELADLVIAYVGVPSLGVGMELAYAETQNTPIILLYEKGKQISRFPRGIPTKIAEIQFEDYEDALIQLKAVLQQWQRNQLSKG
ncbi:MAG: XRE family transcriptional regulator [Chloroflexaceae bacterium]|nr:XRE family transcriptional regulator [Chloroflexaceae bacterium]